MPNKFRIRSKLQIRFSGVVVDETTSRLLEKDRLGEGFDRPEGGGARRRLVGPRGGATSGCSRGYGGFVEARFEVILVGEERAREELRNGYSHAKFR